MKHVGGTMVYKPLTQNCENFAYRMKYEKPPRLGYEATSTIAAAFISSILGAAAVLRGWKNNSRYSSF
jgi:hypothetical protein